MGNNNYVLQKKLLQIQPQHLTKHSIKNKNTHKLSLSHSTKHFFFIISQPHKQPHSFFRAQKLKKLKEERKEKKTYFSSLSCSSIVAIEFHKKGSTLLFSSTQLTQGKINSFIHIVFLFRFFIIFGKEYVENHILNFFPYLNS